MRHYCPPEKQGTAQAFQQSLGTVPLLILAALVVVYLILGILYESASTRR